MFWVYIQIIFLDGEIMHQFWFEVGENTVVFGYPVLCIRFLMLEKNGRAVELNC